METKETEHNANNNHNDNGKSCTFGQEWEYLFDIVLSHLFFHKLKLPYMALLLLVLLTQQPIKISRVFLNRLWWVKMYIVVLVGGGKQKTNPKLPTQIPNIDSEKGEHKNLTILECNSQQFLDYCGHAAWINLGVADQRESSLCSDSGYRDTELKTKHHKLVSPTQDIPPWMVSSSLLCCHLTTQCCLQLFVCLLQIWIDHPALCSNTWEGYLLLDVLSSWYPACRHATFLLDVCVSTQTALLLSRYSPSSPCLFHTFLHSLLFFNPFTRCGGEEIDQQKIPVSKPHQNYSQSAQITTYNAVLRVTWTDPELKQSRTNNPESKLFCPSLILLILVSTPSCLETGRRNWCKES